MYDNAILTIISLGKPQISLFCLAVYILETVWRVVGAVYL